MLEAKRGGTIRWRRPRAANVIDRRFVFDLDQRHTPFSADRARVTNILF
jgi:hypothetical protein